MFRGEMKCAGTHESLSGGPGCELEELRFRVAFLGLPFGVDADKGGRGEGRLDLVELAVLVDELDPGVGMHSPKFELLRAGRRSDFFWSIRGRWLVPSTIHEGKAKEQK